MNRKSLLYALLTYAMWGSLPLFWKLLSGMDALVILCGRILFSAAYTVALLALKKELPQLKALLMDRSSMRYLVPAAVIISGNWWLYIWAVNHGHVLDASLGYYMNPLMMFLCGLIAFKEKCGALDFTALALACCGVLMSTLRLQSFPVIAVSLALSFAAYGVLKKLAHAEGLASIAVETLVISPLALAYLLISPGARAALAAASAGTWALLLLAGPATAIPLIFYTKSVNDLPLTALGFIQYLSPTLMLVIGLLFGGESLAPGQLAAFLLIWAGLALYTVGLIRRERALRLGG